MASPPESARSAALDLLESVLGRRRPLDDAFADHPGIRLLATRDRAFARLLVTTTLRRLGEIDALIACRLARPLPAKARDVRNILRLGACQLAFLETPPHAAVDTMVSLAAARVPSTFKALVNAVLRRLASESPVPAAPGDAGRLNTPDWLWNSWRAAYGDATARAIATTHLGEPPLDITVKRDAPSWAARLEATVLPTGTLRRPIGGMVSELAGFADGAWWVQDAAAALPAHLLGEVAGKTVLDLCAAPGGKTAQLAAAGARVIAVDRRPRMALLKENLARLRLGAETIAADVAEWRPAERAPLVLLDAPCTATGTIRRHPDVAHLKSAADVPRLTAVQDRLLAAAADMLAPGGTLVYCACSLEPAEGPERVEALLARDRRLVRVAVEAHEVGGLAELVSKAGDVRTLPCHLAGLGGLDGFYAARLRRTG